MIGGSFLMLLGCGIVRWCFYVGYAAYVLAGLLGLRDIRYLDSPTAGEVAIIFALGVALFVLGFGWCKTVSRDPHGKAVA